LAGGGFYVFLAGGSKDLKDTTILSSAFISCTLLLPQIRFYGYGKHFSSVKKKLCDALANNFLLVALVFNNFNEPLSHVLPPFSFAFLSGGHFINFIELWFVQ
jgi:hypothetical protein